MPVRRAAAQAASQGPSAIKPYLPHQAGFKEKCDSLIWQAMKPQRTPAAIYEVRSEEDVLDVIVQARSSGRRVSIVSGGHSYVGNGIQEDALLLDMSSLTDVQIDVSARRAKVQPGVRSIPFASALEKHSLAFPVPHCPMIGMGGYLLGGGMGWNAESWNNFACFNIVAVEAITAEGERLVADRSNHVDLFWAARGGGPNFPGVVTRFLVNVFPRPAAIRESTYIYPLAALDSVVAWLERGHADQPPQLELALIFGTTEPQSAGAAPVRQCVVSAIYFAESNDAARAMHNRLVQGRPTETLFNEELIPRTISDLLGEDKEVPVRHCMQTMWTDDPGRTALIVGKRFAEVPSPGTVALVNYRARQNLPDDAAYSRCAKAFLYVDATWSNPADDEANRKWADVVMADLSALDRGSYINEADYVRHPVQATNAFAPANLERLKRIAHRYDPRGLFVTPLNPQNKRS